LITHIQCARTAQRGIVLVSSLLLLLVVTIVALSMFRSFGIQEKIAGNMREKQRALQAAVTAEQFAEVWLGSNSGSTPSAPCTTLMNGNIPAQGQICSNQLSNLSLFPNGVTGVPWIFDGKPVGVTFTPLNMPIGTATSTVNPIAGPTYASAPTFYISDLGPSPEGSAPGEIYQIDAVGYGGNSNTVAVVESTYVVSTNSVNVGGP
jgi:type IV pilus assembly protein PilX